LGKDEATIKSKYGEPAKQIKSSSGNVFLYKMKYGTLRLNFAQDGRVNLIGMHSVAPKAVELCD